MKKMMDDLTPQLKLAILEVFYTSVLPGLDNSPAVTYLQNYISLWYGDSEQAISMHKWEGHCKYNLNQSKTQIQKYPFVSFPSIGCVAI